MNPTCGECGDEFGDNLKECCLIYMCDDCSDRHDEKWHKDEPVPYRITEAGRAMLRDAQQGVEK